MRAASGAAAGSGSLRLRGMGSFGGIGTRRSGDKAWHRGWRLVSKSEIGLIGQPMAGEEIALGGASAAAFRELIEIYDCL